MSQIKPIRANLPNHTYQTKLTKPNLPNQTYQTKPTKSNLPNGTYQHKPNCQIQTILVNQALIKAWQVYVCPELGTAQPQLVCSLMHLNPTRRNSHQESPLSEADKKQKSYRFSPRIEFCNLCILGQTLPLPPIYDFKQRLFEMTKNH